MWEVPPKIKKIAHQTMRVLRSCKDLTDKIPKPADTKYEKIVKTGAIVENAINIFNDIRKDWIKDPTETLTHKLGLEKVIASFFSKLLYEFYNNGVIDAEIIDIDKIKRFIIFSFGNQKIALYKIYETEKSENVDASVYMTKNFDSKGFLDRVWEKLDNRISFSYLSQKLQISKLELSPDEILLFDRSKNILDLDIGNCFLITGPPGTGKSSWVYEYAKQNNKKLIKIDPESTKMMGVRSMRLLLDSLNPDIILFDDMDRSELAKGSASTLSIFEVFHNNYPETMFILTSNYPEKIEKAMFRTGRIDYVIEFDLPNEDERRQIIKTIIQDEANIEDLVNRSNDLCHSDLVGLVKKAKIIGIPKALLIIEHLKKFQSKAHAFEFKKHDLYR